MKEPDYQGFWNTLPHMAMLSGRPQLQEEFRKQYREEIIGHLTMLHRLGLVWGATSLHPEPPSECDLCAAPFTDASYFVDGRAPNGASANMCPRCFLEDGHSIGWGSGQLYLSLGNGSWRLVAGGDPGVLDEDYEL